MDLRDLERQLYYPAYLINAALGAMVPGVLGILFGRSGRDRTAFGFVIVVVIAVSLGGVYAGALEDRTVSLIVARVLSFTGITGFALFWGAFVLGYTRGIDPYLAVFTGVRTFFVVLLPIQQAFFEVLGPTGSAVVSSITLGIQLVAYFAHLLIVLALLRKLSRGHVISPVRLTQPA